MADLGKAYVQIIPSAKGMTSSIQSQINGTSIGSSVGGKMSTAMKGAIAAAAIGTFLKDTIMEGANLEQNLGGTEAVFASFSKNIQASAQTAYKNMGLSASDYMATANKMGSLFQGSGISQQKSLTLTQDAMQRTADVASVMGIDMGLAMESITGAAKGNFTMMDNLGVAMNVATLEAYALEKGLNFKWDQATQAEKNELAMKMFMDRTSQYAGNFARESEETIAGSLGALKSSWSNFLGSLTLGQDMGPAITGLVETVINAAKNIVPALINIVTQLPLSIMQVLANLAPQIGPGISNLIITLLNNITTMIPQLILAGTQVLQGLQTGILSAIPKLIQALPQIITSLVNGILQGWPMIMNCGIQLLTALVAALPQIINTIITVLPQIIDSIITAILENIPLIIEAGIELFTAIIGNLPVIITTIIEAIPQIIDSVITAILKNIPLLVQAGVQLFVALIKNTPAIIAGIIKAIPTIIGGVLKSIGSFIGEFAKMGKNLIQGLWNGIKNVGSWLWSKISGFFGGIVDNIKDFFGIKSPSRLFMGFGEDIDKGMAIGITDNMSIVDKAMAGMEKSVAGKMQSELAVSASALNDTMNGDMEGATIALDTTNLENVIERCIEKVLTSMQMGQNIVLDDGTLVGAIGGTMDAKLGEIASGRKRGY